MRPPIQALGFSGSWTESELGRIHRPVTLGDLAVIPMALPFVWWLGYLPIYALVCVSRSVDGDRVYAALRPRLFSAMAVQCALVAGYALFRQGNSEWHRTRAAFLGPTIVLLTVALNAMIVSTRARLQSNPFWSSRAVWCAALAVLVEIVVCMGIFDQDIDDPFPNTTAALGWLLLTVAMASIAAVFLQAEGNHDGRHRARRYAKRIAVAMAVAQTVSHAFYPRF